MNMPGFDAEAALGRIGGQIFRRRYSGIRANNLLTPQLPIGGGGFGCGACTPLKWPNGGPTGVCVQDCTDALGRHYFKTCQCGGGGGLLHYGL